MSDVFSITSVGMQDLQHRLETLSRNATAASTPGYRRQVPAARSFANELQHPTLAAPAAVASASTRLDISPGQHVATGRALDVSIDAEDLFFALSDGTRTWVTRHGSFRLDENGALVGERGLRVQGISGDIHLGGTDVEIRANGEIVRDGVVVAALQLFRPNERTRLQSAGGTLIDAPDGVQAVSPSSVRIRSGGLESSNVSAGNEMVQVLALARQYESLVRVTQGYDEALGRAIQKLGDV